MTDGVIGDAGAGVVTWLTLSGGALASTAFGAIMTAIAFAIARYSETRRERRIKLTIDLHAEWHTPTFLDLRIRAHDTLTRFNGDAARAFAEAETQDRHAVYAVVHYFERMALLSRSGVLEPVLLRRFMRQYALWWRPLLCGPDVTARDDPEWGETVAEIDRLLQRVGGGPGFGKR